MNIKQYFKRQNTIKSSNNVDEVILGDILNQRGNIDQVFPSDFTEDEKKVISSVKKFTMTSGERLVSLCRSVDYIETNKISGDIVECGVWKGGSMMAVAQRLIQLKNQNRKLFLFDTFEGMSQPTKQDVDINLSSAVDLYGDDKKEDDHEKWCLSPLEEVRDNLYSTNYDIKNISFIKGKVEETLPHKDINKIAILRLDTDWYESTKHELSTLYTKLVSGGILIIDDYGHWSGARKAVDEFIKENGLALFLNRVDYTCRLIIKP